MQKIIQSKNFIFIISSLPFLLITGPFLSDLVVSISSILFLSYIVLKKKFILLRNNFFYFFIAFCFLIFVSSSISIDPLLSYESSLFYFRIIIFAFLICYLINYDKKILNYFYNVLLICFSILIFDGYIQFIFGKNIFLIPSNYGRVASFFGEELVLGSYLSRLFPLFFALFLIKKKKKRYENYIIATIFICLDVLIYLTGERTSFFLLNISTIYIIILIKEYKVFRIFTFVVSILIIIAITATNDSIKQRMVEQPLRSIEIKKSIEINQNNNLNDQPELGRKIFSDEHTKIYITAYEMFKDKPILGHGPKIFRLTCKKYKFKEIGDGCSTHPHNFYLQLLVETGIIGFSFIFIALLYLIKETFYILARKKKASSQEICLLSCFLITLWPIAPSGNIFNNWLMIVYILPLGFYLNIKLSNKPKLRKENIIRNS